MARNTHVQARDVALRIEPGAHLALRDRVELAVQHVFFARPDQLDGHPRHLLGQRYRLVHIVGLTTATKATAQMQLVDIALRRRQTGRFRRGGQCSFSVLCRCPYLAALRGVTRRGVHGLHGGVVLVRVGIHRVDLARRPRDGSACVADRVGHHRLGRVQPGLEHGGKTGTRQLGVGTLVPFNR